MSDVKHTPAPWVQAESDPRFIFALWDPRGSNRFHCHVQNGGPSYACEEEQIANANLIAAAPEMLEVLQLVADQGGMSDRMFNEVMAPLEAVIAKAKGATQ